MTAAFEAALVNVADDSRTDLQFRAHSLRRRIAAGVVAAARDGVTDVERLTAEALRSLHEIG